MGQTYEFGAMVVALNRTYSALTIDHTGMSEAEREYRAKLAYQGDIAAGLHDDPGHVQGCRCERCRNLIAAITAQDAEGEYFFTDDELVQIANEPGEDGSAGGTMIGHRDRREEPKPIKISVPLSIAIHQAAKMEAICRSLALSGVLAEIIDARVRGLKLRAQSEKVQQSIGGGGLVRSSVFIPPALLRMVEDAARKAQLTVPQLIGEWIAAHFERRKAAVR